MASIIDSTYFTGELSIAQISQPAVAAALQQLIDSREPELLKGLMGLELYEAYTAGMAVLPTPDQKWLDILNGKQYSYYNNTVKYPGLKFALGSSKKSLIANYVYYWHLRDNHSFTTGSGEKKTDEAINVLPNLKLIRAWNEMVAWNKSLRMFLSISGNYDDYKLNAFSDDVAFHRSLLCTVNQFNL